MSQAHLAIDLGASSGRAMLALLEGNPLKVRLEEVHRFKHEACPTPTGPVWDLTGIWQQILTGLGKASAWCRENDAELLSIGVDTWGVDWTLLGGSGELLALPHCYRDPQNEAACERVLERLGGFKTLYERTGLQLMAINTLFQVAARHEAEPKLFDAAARLVFLPDLFHFWLSGELVTDRTFASTSSMLDLTSGDWDIKLLEQLRLPTHMLGPLVEPGTTVGALRSELAEATGAPTSMRVITPASHDTASAVAAVPATTASSIGGGQWAYLSSGTWSLLGAELASPINSAEAREVPFTNERGVEKTIRFLKNIGGLWLMQELQRDLEQQGQSHDFAELVEEADRAESGRTLVDPNYASFAAPGDFLAKLRTYAQDTEQPEPETAGQAARCCLESLALCYAETLDQLESVLGHSIETLHLVGGGTKNTLLNQFTAAATGKATIVGPVEATAVGNALVQAMGCGRLENLAEIREVVARSFSLQRLEPGQGGAWDDLRAKYETLVSSN